MQKSHKKTQRKHISHRTVEKAPLIRRVLYYSATIAIVLVVVSVFSYVDVLNKLARSYRSSDNPSVQGVMNKKERENIMRKISLYPSMALSLTPAHLRCRPQLLKPAHLAVADTLFGFAWKTDCAEPPVSYQLRITGAGIRPIVINDITETSYTLTDTSIFKEGKRYTWSVGACYRKNMLTATPTTGQNNEVCRSYKWAEPKRFFWKSKPKQLSVTPVSPEVSAVLEPTTAISSEVTP